MPHKRTHMPEYEVELEKVITPMLDMAFQLLVFFILTYHPSSMEMQIDGTLLPAKQPKQASVLPPEPPPSNIDPEPKLEETLTVIVEALTAKDQVDAKYIGSPKSIKLMRPENVGKLETIFTNEHGDDLEKGLTTLESVLKKILASNPGASDTEINIKGDGDLAWENLLQVQDICRIKYGVRTVAGKEQLIKVTSRRQEAEFQKKVGFKSVGYVPPPEEPKKP
jgi:biopolymer transport protein ExbD